MESQLALAACVLEFSLTLFFPSHFDGATTLNVIMLSVIMLGVVAPL
jgi:hypothetical protein